MMIAITYQAHQQNSKTRMSSSPLSQAAPPFLMSGSTFLPCHHGHSSMMACVFLSGRNFIFGDFFINRIREFINNAGK